jgi:hypothetical protein
MTKDIAHRTILGIGPGCIAHLLGRLCGELDCNMGGACLMQDADKAFSRGYLQSAALMQLEWMPALLVCLLRGRCILPQARNLK